MTILGKKGSLDKENGVKEYQLPSVLKQDEDEMSFAKSLIISTVLHPVTVFTIWFLIFVAGLLGLTFITFKRPEAKPKDIEFVLVEKEGTPIDKNTRFRSDRNSRAGGKHDPKRKVSLPKAGGGGAPAPKRVVKQQQSQPQAIPQKVVKKQEATTKTKKTESSGPARVQAPMPAPRPSVKPSAPKVTNKPKSDIVIPVPKSNIPRFSQPAGTGPIATPTGTGTGGSGKASSGGSSLSFAPTGGSSASTGRTSSGSGGGRGTGTGIGTGAGRGSGNVGNPGPGNPKGAPGIDAIKEPDFGPYMRELQQRIKRNWDPPKGEESRRVVLLFTISRDGRLMNVKVYKSSGLQSADRAAISAVQLTAPFRPLPAEYKESNVDIQFTFDYNVFGAKKY